MRRAPAGLVLLTLLAACSSNKTTPSISIFPTLPGHLERASFTELPGWLDAEPSEALDAFKRSCYAIPRTPENWNDVCSAGVTVPKGDQIAARVFFERWFRVYRVKGTNGDQGKFTGYYEAELKASRKRTKKYRYPVFGKPRGLRRIRRSVIEDCADDWVRALERRRTPRLNRYVRVGRRRYEACRFVRRWPVIMWTDNRVDLFITEIQGSARVKLEDGKTTRIGYAGQNGHGYVAVGRLLIERKHIDVEDMSMQAIREWLNKNPRDGRRLMHDNPSYVFFKERKKETQDEPGPRGAMNVALTPGRSVAVDPNYIPLGAPVWVATTMPVEPKERQRKRTPLRRLLIAQDVGGVIKGAIRGDFYWGTGEDALKHAGFMNEEGRWYLLLPKSFYQFAAFTPPPVSIDAGETYPQPPAPAKQPAVPRPDADAKRQPAPIINPETEPAAAAKPADAPTPAPPPDAPDPAPKATQPTQPSQPAGKPSVIKRTLNRLGRLFRL